MDIQKIIKKLSSVLRVNHSRVDVLRNVRLSDGTATVTDGTTWSVLKIDNPRTATIDCAMYCKTGDFDFSDTVVGVEFPNAPKPTVDRIPLPVAVFSESRENMLKFAATDESRGTLRGLNYQLGYGWYCTDGHRAIINHNIPGLDRSLSIRPETVRAVAALVNAGAIVEDCFISGERLMAETGGTYWKNEYIHVITSAGSIISKIDLSDSIPELSKVVPDMKDQFAIDIPADGIPILVASLKKLLPYANEKTHLVKVRRNRLFLENRDTGSAVDMELPFNIQPETYEYEKIEDHPALFAWSEGAYRYFGTKLIQASGVVMYDKDKNEADARREWVENYNKNHAGIHPFFPIGINALYFADLLSDIVTDGLITIGYRTAISAITIQPGNGIEYLLMPLRICDEGDEQPEPVGYTRLDVPEVKRPKRKATSRKFPTIEECKRYLYQVDENPENITSGELLAVETVYNFLKNKMRA